MSAPVSATAAPSETMSIKIYWTGSSLLADPPTLNIPYAFTGTITFTLENDSKSNVTFYNRGIVFQYPHQPFTYSNVDVNETVVAFADVAADPGACGEFKYAVLLQDSSGTDGTHVYYFDPTVENDPPPPEGTKTP